MQDVRRKPDSHFFPVYIRKSILFQLYKPLDGGSCKYYFFNFEATILPETNELPSHISIVPHAGLVNGHAYSSIGSYTSASRVEQYIKSASYRIKEVFEQADRLHPDKSFSDQLLLDNLLRELLIQTGKNTAPKLNNKLAEILDYVHRNYTKAFFRKKQNARLVTQNAKKHPANSEMLLIAVLDPHRPASFHAAASNIFSIKIPYPVVGSLTRT